MDTKGIFFEEVDQMVDNQVFMAGVADELGRLQSAYNVSHWEFCHRVSETRRNRIQAAGCWEQHPKLSFNENDLYEFILFARGARFFPLTADEVGERKVRNFPLEEDGSGLVYDILQTLMLVATSRIQYPQMGRYLADMKNDFEILSAKVPERLGGAAARVEMKLRRERGRPRNSKSLEESIKLALRKRIAEDSILEQIVNRMSEYGLMQPLDSDDPKEIVELALRLAAIAEKGMELIVAQAAYEARQGEALKKMTEHLYTQIEERVFKVNRDIMSTLSKSLIDGVDKGK